MEVPRLAGWGLFVLIAMAVVLGGGGVRYGLFNLVVQLAAIALLALNGRAVERFVRRSPRPLVILVALSLALPLLQIVPLPPALWQALPGREVVRESLALAGSADMWFPISVDAGRTLLAFIALLPPLAVLVLARKLDRQGKERALWLLVWLGLASIALGVVQLLTGNSAGNWYPGGNPAHLYGTFANHNAAALFLVIALLALIALPLPHGQDRKPQIMLRAVGGLVLALGVVLTQSRSGVALMTLAPAFLLLRFLRARSGARGGRYFAAVPLAGAVLLALGASALVLSSERVQQTAARFSDLEDSRPGLWRDSLAAARRYWPAGSGIGTFDEVFQLDESLEHLQRGRAGRAHQDYLEVAIESGLAGLALLVGWGIWIALCATRALRAGREAIASGSGFALLAIALQSLLDYPLRNEALLCVAALLAAILFCEADAAARKNSGAD